MSTENGRSLKTGNFRPPTSRDSCHRDIKTNAFMQAAPTPLFFFPPSRHPLPPIFSFVSNFVHQATHTQIVSVSKCYVLTTSIYGLQCSRARLPPASPPNASPTSPICRSGVNHDLHYYLGCDLCTVVFVDISQAR
ncbi:hypothetical protein K438DRAFT_1935233 [Mycena galopus ATCC 62051]|nr:hypothetical protein K438DRAFT_1935233 [Mycena galopus ATCC 62051]